MPRQARRKTPAAHDDANTLRQDVKQALADLHNLPALSNSPLAAQVPRAYLLAAGGDRGLALQQLLRDAIESLGAGEPSQAALSRKDRPYHACRLRYLDRLSPQEAQDRLAVSDYELYHALREGLHAILKFWDWAVAPAPPSANLEAIPHLQRFVGRQQELAFFRKRLAEKHLAIICGMAGVGKTSLGMELVADRDPHHLLWIRFIPDRNTTLELLLEDLGQALAAGGQPDYLRFLQLERQKAQPLSLNSQVRYLVSLLAEGGYTLCLDDYHLVDADPLITSLGTDLWYQTTTGRLDLVVMSRTTQRFARDWDFPLLTGMSLHDARQLLASEGLDLPDTALATLHAKTGGSPLFLKLFAAWAKSTECSAANELGVLSEQVAQLEYEEAVQGYLLHEVESTLPPDAVHVATCAAALRTAFSLGDSDLLKLLADEGVADTWSARHLLQQRHLALLQPSGVLSFHPLVKAYFYARLVERPDEKARVHHRLAGYCERRQDWLEAAYHHVEAGEREAAALRLGEQVRAIINAGQGRAALEQLERLAAYLAQAQPELRFQAEAAREALCHLLGERQKQALAIEAMVALAQTLGDGLRLATAYNRRARMHEILGDYPAALAAAEAAQVAARQAGDRQAEMHALLESGTSHMRLGEFATARQCYERAIDLARETGNRPGQARGLNSLGLVYWNLDNIESAQQSFQDAMAIYHAIGDRQGESRCLNNLGVAYYWLGDYTAAQACYEQSLAIAQAISDQQFVENNLNNLGLINHDLGDYVTVQMYYEQSLAVARAIGDRLGEAITLENLGAACHELDEDVTAQVYCEQALTILQEVGARREMAGTLTDLGMTLESLGKLDSAEAAYRQALEIRREIGQNALVIEDVAGLARVQEARHVLSEAKGGKRQEAKGYAEECLAYIAAHGVDGIEYVFEVYLTCADILETCGERSRARAVLEEAHTLLVQRADKIGDEAMRRSYMENVPTHRELMRQWASAT